MRIFKKFLAGVLVSFALATPSFGQDMLGGYGGTPSVAGPGSILGNPSWWKRDLTFWAPFDDPSVPLAIYKGTGSFTFTRAHDATHTATYVHPGTGLVTVASADQLRIESNGALIEGARTNLLVYSADLSNAAWTKRMVSISSAVAPDGTTAPIKMKTDATAGEAHYVIQEPIPGGLADNTDYMVFLYLKAGEGAQGRWVQLVFVNKAVTVATMYVDLVSGVLGTTVAFTSTAIRSMGGGWYRVEAKLNSETGAYAPVFGVRMAIGDGGWIFDGDNTSYVYVWGTQVEAGTFPSSYIPTVATAMTRNADVLTFATSGNVSGTVGTVAATYKTIGNNAATSQYILDLNNARPVLFVNGADEKLSINDGATTTSFGTADTHGTSYNGASRWFSADSKVRVVRGGGTVVDGVFDNNMNLGANATIGDSGTTGSLLWGWVKNLKIWNRALSDAEMIAITQ